VRTAARAATPIFPPTSVIHVAGFHWRTPVAGRIEQTQTWYRRGRPNDHIPGRQHDVAHPDGQPETFGPEVQSCHQQITGSRSAVGHAESVQRLE